ncbi:MAG TPA: formyltransferase family protein [Acidimicrobiales bacterium]
MTKSVKTAVVLGKGELAVRVCEWFRSSEDHELIAVVPVVPEPTWTTSLIDWTLANDVPHVQSGKVQDLSTVIGDRRIDLAISVFYDKILAPWFIDSCGRILNIHNGPLPRYQGVSPINWALKNGEIEHGVTIHELTAGIDSGPIVSQLKFSIYPEIDEVIDVYNRALEYGWVLFCQTMPMLDRITPRPQDPSLALYYSRKQDELLGDRRGFTRQTAVSA